MVENNTNYKSIFVLGTKRQIYWARFYNGFIFLKNLEPPFVSGRGKTRLKMLKMESVT